MNKLRNLTPKDNFPDSIEYLSLEELANRRKLAEWYMKRAGMSVEPDEHCIKLTQVRRWKAKK